MKSFKSTYVFATLVIAFSFYVYMFEFRASLKEDEQKSVSEKVFPFEQSEVEEVQIESSVGEAIHLEKGEERWNIVKPKQDLADEAEMVAMLSTLTASKGEIVIDNEEIDKKEFGLDKPLGKILVRGAGRVESLLVASESSYDGKMYVQPEGKNVLKLVDTVVTDILKRQVDELRDKVVLRTRLIDVNRVEYRLRGQKKFAVVDLDGVWKLEESTSRLDPEEVKEFFGNIEDLRIAKFVVDNPEEADFKRLNLSAPEHQFIILNGKKTIKLGISAESDGIAFVSTTAQAPIMSLPVGRLKKVLIEADDLKDRRAPFDFESSQVDEIQLTRKNEKIEIIRDGEEWKLKSPISGKVLNRSKVRSFVKNLGTLRADQFLSAEKPDILKESENRVVLNNKDGISVLELAWGGEFTRTEGESEVKYIRVQTNRVNEPVGVLMSDFDDIRKPGLVEAKVKVKKK